MKKYDISAIMRRAHDIRRANTYDGLRAVWGMCVAMAWEEAKNPAAAPLEDSQTAEEYVVRAAYQVRQIDGAALVKWMTAAARSAARWEIRRADDPNTYAQSNETVLWGLYEQGLQDIAQDGCLRLYSLISDPARLEKIYYNTTEGRKPRALAQLVYSAARAACAKWRRDAVKFAASRERIIEDGEGHEMGELSNVADYRRDTAADGISRATLAAVREAVEELGEDVAAVFRLLVAGVTERDIAERLGMTKASVHRRIVKAREVALALVG